MDNTSVIQVRVPEEMRKAAEKRVSEVGLSSVQEAIRIFLHSFITKRVGMGVVSEPGVEYVNLSKQAQKRYAVIERDLDQGKNIVSFDDPNEAMSWLTKKSK